jgi:hypothetical protein
VYEPPVANFSGSPLSGCFPLRVQFADMSTPGTGNTLVSWLWDFGNGYTSTLQNPLATYNTTGTFTITLRVTDDKGCTKTYSRPNYKTITDGEKELFRRLPFHLPTTPPARRCSAIFGILEMAIHQQQQIRFTPIPAVEVL